MSLRSLIETVACLHQAIRQKQISGDDVIKARNMYRQANQLMAKLQAMRNAIAPDRKWVREEQVEYTIDIANVTDEEWLSSVVRRLSS